MLVKKHKISRAERRVIEFHRANFGFGFGFGRLQRQTQLKPQRGRIPRLQPTAVGATRASVTQPQRRFCEIMLEKGGQKSRGEIA